MFRDATSEGSADTVTVRRAVCQAKGSLLQGTAEFMSCHECEFMLGVPECALSAVSGVAHLSQWELHNQVRLLCDCSGTI